VVWREHGKEEEKEEEDESVGRQEDGASQDVCSM
jgi:hypothetical protein